VSPSSSYSVSIYIPAAQSNPYITAKAASVLSNTFASCSNGPQITNTEANASEVLLSTTTTACVQYQNTGTASTYNSTTINSV